MRPIKYSNICISTGDCRVDSYYMLPVDLNSFGFSGVLLEMKLIKACSVEAKDQQRVKDGIISVKINTGAASRFGYFVDLNGKKGLAPG